MFNISLVGPSVILILRIGMAVQLDWEHARAINLLFLCRFLFFFLFPVLRIIFFFFPNEGFTTTLYGVNGLARIRIKEFGLVVFQL
jgi:hypothetical protein